MAKRVARVEVGGEAIWASETARGLMRIDGDFPTTRAFFENGGPQAAALGGRGEPLGEVRFLSPVTHDATFLCQATNYADHVREVGGNPNHIVNNVIFTKASSSIAPPDTDIVRPAHVRLLDYELELGLVLGRRLAAGDRVLPEALHEWIGGLVIVNDVTARDVQISHTQFHKSKSYRTFGPVGPWLVLPTAAEFARLFDLELTLQVDGARRQHAEARQMIFKPAATLTELAGIMDMNAGDLIATGTPGGVALHPPGAFVQALGGFLSPKARFKAFLKGQAKRTHYLRAGQRITATIRTPDGTIDLGQQSNLIVDPN